MPYPVICGVCLSDLKGGADVEAQKQHIDRGCGTPLIQTFHCPNKTCPRFSITMVVKPSEAKSALFGGFTGFAPIPYHGEYDRVPRKARDDEPFCGHCGARKK